MGKTLLVIPPLTPPCEPEPGAVVLGGHLVAQGADSSVFDANLRFFELLLEEGIALAGTPQGIRRSANRIRMSADALRNPDTYRDVSAYRNALSVFSQTIESVGENGAKFSVSDYIHADLSPLSSQDLATAAREPQLLGAYGALKTLAREILAHNPAIIGVSLSYLSQALHSFALAGELRRQGFDGLLILGGSLIGSLAERLNPGSPFFHDWDAVVTGPAEDTLLGIINCGISDQRGVMAPRLGVFSPVARCAPASSHPPDFSGLPWNRYFSPGGVAVLTASRGCYWAKCAFCPEAEQGIYQRLTPEDLADSLIALKHNHGVRLAHFTDNAISPNHLKRLARKLKGHDIGWYGFARIERSLAKPGFMEDLADGGLKMLQLGIESASERLLSRMGKGIDLKLADQVLRRAHDNNIRVFGYFLFGSPTETEDEAKRTLDWIGERAHLIDFLNLSVMNLPRSGILAQNPQGFGLDELSPLDDRNDLTLYWGFTGEGTIDRRTIRKLLGDFKKIPAVKNIFSNTPKGFKSKHAAFSPQSGVLY